VPEKRGIWTLGSLINRLSGCSFLRNKEINSSAEGVIAGSKGYVNKPVHFLSSDVGVFPTYTIKCWDQKKKKLFGALML